MPSTDALQSERVTGQRNVAPSSDIGDIELISVHDDILVAESNRVHGNTDPRFGRPDEVVSARIRLAGSVGCRNTVVMVSQNSNRFHGLDDDPIIGKVQGYKLWPKILQPTEDQVYDPNDPPFMMNLPGDGLITNRPKNGLMLGTADCSSAVMYDVRNQVLALAHIGREGAVLDIGPQMIQYMRRRYGTHAADIVTHFGSSIAPESYVLTYLSEALRQEAWKDYIFQTRDGFETDVVGYAVQRLLEQGVQGENVTRSTIDVATHPDFFSLVKHKKDLTIADGRNGMVAVIH